MFYPLVRLDEAGRKSFAALLGLTFAISFFRKFAVLAALQAREVSALAQVH
jgi:hypothetical protein